MGSKILKIITKNAQETQKAAIVLAQEIINQSGQRDKVLVIGLEGELGSGKTTFVQGLAQGLKIKNQITSPTFVILKRYQEYFYHIDCYRIQSKDLLDLDFKEILNQPQNIVVIEWAKRVKEILPPDTLWIKFEYLNLNERKITL